MFRVSRPLLVCTLLTLLLAAGIRPQISKAMTAQPGNGRLEPQETTRLGVDLGQTASTLGTGSYLGGRAGLTCANPLPDEIPSCQLVEQQILASTVRIEIEGWIKEEAGDAGSGLFAYRHATGDGHGTIQGGRYLVTHNHFGVPFSGSDARTGVEFARASLFDASGHLLVEALPLSDILVVVEQSETLVLDFGTKAGGQGFFEWLGISSTRFASWRELNLRPGSEAAQVDWDGKMARVNWVVIEDIISEQGTPRLVLAEGVRPGASGGGVFWNGLHVGNNWQLIEYGSGNGDVSRQDSTAALNSHQVAAHG